MLKHRLVQALLLWVPATAALLATASIVQPAEECRLKPGAAAPSGSKWLYRINRADHRHCWFLSSKAVGLPSQLSRTGFVRHRRLTGDTAAVQRDQQVDSDLETASTTTDKTNVAGTAVVAEAVEPSALPQVAAHSVDPSPEYLIPRSVPTITYRPSSANAATVSGKAVSAARTPAGASKSNVVLLGGAAAVGLLFAAGAFHFTRRVHLRSRTRAIADWHGVRGPVVVRSSVAAKPSPMMSDPAEGVKRSLRELDRYLEPALAACNLPLSDQMGAVYLPDAAAWLSRPKAKATTEQGNRQLADA
jgi:hypothetical protein